MKTSLTGLGAIMSSRRNFLWYSMFSIAAPCFGVALWLLPDARTSYTWLVFLALISVAGAYVWGVLMWAFFDARKRARPAPSLERNDVHLKKID